MMNNYIFPMTQPNHDDLIQALRNGLTSNFAEVAIDWVNCPDLTQPPFNLAAPGLCGNTAIIQIGGTGFMFPRMQRTMSISFNDFLAITRREYIDNFLIGGCICPRPSNGHLAELTTDVLFASHASRYDSISQCRLAYFDEIRGSSNIEYLSSGDDYICNMMGNFFVSEGLTGPVLRIYAKRQIGLDFTEAMQFALAQQFTSDNHVQRCIGLGGAFIARNGIMRHHVLRNCLDGHMTSRLDIYNLFHYFDINTPVIGVGMFLSTDNAWMKVSQPSDEYINLALTKRQFHTGRSDKGGFYHGNVGTMDTIEYLGYFSLAHTMYRLRSSTPYPTFPEFSYLTSFC